MAAPALLACMAMAASLYGLPQRALPAIQAVEGGKPGLEHRNRDGSRDLGIMQVNTRWLPALARYTGASEQEVEHRLLGKDCYNIAVAGWILRIYLNEAKSDVLRAVGFYHSHTSALATAYQAAVMSEAWRLFGKDSAR